jgi:DNA-binding transcriptional LysR family regulator
MTDPLDSRQLRAFVILAETGSFTETARRLHLSQSAISHAMKTLENDLRCRLLDRVAKKVLLTQAGEQLLVRAYEVLNLMNSARAEISDLGRWGRGRLRIGASTTVCQHILPAVLREFKESFPSCDIQIEPGDAAHSLEMLRSHRIDLALTLLPGPVEEQFQFRPLFSDALQFIVSPLHPWARAGKVERGEIGQQQFIVYGRTSLLVEMVEEYFKHENIVLRFSMELGNMEAIKEMIKVGIGISILAPWVARKEIAEKSLVALPLGKRKLQRQWGILQWRNHRGSLAEETFVGLCKAVTESLEAHY